MFAAASACRIGAGAAHMGCTCPLLEWIGFSALSLTEIQGNGAVRVVDDSVFIHGQIVNGSQILIFGLKVRLRLGEDLLCPGGVVFQEHGGSYGQALGRIQAAGFLVSHIVVLAVSGADGAAGMGMDSRHDGGNIAHIGAAGPPGAAGHSTGPGYRFHSLCQDLRHVGVVI